ncbi:MAG: hypothetical protein GY855_16155 [candidate division Zixibacteria bacterium]|nr:hypothetical protein [candidate division Zixibacteria bacterium]
MIYKKFSILIIPFLLTFLLTGLLSADVDNSYVYKIPDYMKNENSIKKLREFIYSAKTTDRIVTCLRLAEIGGEQSLQLLKEAVEKEPYYSVVDPCSGVKYYALTSIGKIGGSEAEEYLNSIISRYSIQNGDGLNHMDSIVTLHGAFEGLYEMGTNSAVFSLEDVYKNKDLYWFERDLADLILLKCELRSEKITTAADTAQYLIEQLKPYDEYPKHMDEHGVNDQSFRYKNARFWLFQFRKITLPYLEEYILELPYNNSKAEDLKKLRDSMIANWPRE